jgi:dephospho-CoA kinase
MLKVGLTGGIGSGKSFISDIFTHLGIPVYNSDDRAKYLMNYSEKIKKEIKKLFGNDSYYDNQLKTKSIAAKVFNDSSLLFKLNQIVHPAVYSDFHAWCKKQNKVNTPFVLKEAAILFESGAYKHMDKNILVTAPQKLRIERVMNRDGVSEDEVKIRIKNQSSAEELMPLADFILKNDDKELILPQIINIYNKLVKEWRNTVNG